MWREPTGGFALQRSCATSGGEGSGCSASCCWRWTAAGVRPPRPLTSRVGLPKPSTCSLRLPPEPLVNGGDERGVSQPLVHPRAQDVQLGFAHRALQPEQEPVVVVGRVVEPVLVGQQRAEDGAQLQE